MSLKLSATVLLVLLVALGAPAAGKDKDPKTHKAKNVMPTPTATQVRTTIVFSDHDRQIISRWVNARGTGLPPGLSKKDQLPPGLQRQLVRNGTLPPGLAKKVQPVPVELERMLPPLPVDYRRVAIGGSLVIMNRNTRVIADVFAF